MRSIWSTEQTDGVGKKGNPYDENFTFFQRAFFLKVAKTPNSDKWLHSLSVYQKATFSSGQNWYHISFFFNDHILFTIIYLKIFTFDFFYGLSCDMIFIHVTNYYVHVVHVNRIYALFCSFADHKSNVSHNIEFVGYRLITSNLSAIE